MKKSDDLKKAISRRKHFRKKHARRTGMPVEFKDGMLVFSTTGKPVGQGANAVVVPKP